MTYEALLDAICTRSDLSLSTGSRLRVPTVPTPFVAPELSVRQMGSGLLQAEVIIISSPAAVGKSTVAKALAAVNKLPLLDLAEVPVSTNALVGLLTTDVALPVNPIEALHRGELAVVVDALDEGRLLSGDTSFEKFLETSWELLLKDRAVPDRPKIILFGRDIAAELVETSLQVLEQSDITSAWLVLEFFDHPGAVRVIEAHAEETARLDKRVWRTTGPTQAVVAAFFDAIEGALRLPERTLWKNVEGRAFAGYAPVLAAIGRLISRETNPARLQTALGQAGVKRAWDVIERVAEEILDREQEKVKTQLERQVSSDVSSDVYAATEQLRYLGQVAHNVPITIVDPPGFSSADREVYRTIVDQQLPEHPFLQQGELTSDVLASIVLAHALVQGMAAIPDPFRLRPLSRQPFLWRAVQRQLDTAGEDLIEGQYLGCILNSLWNDSIAGGVETRCESTDSTGLVRVEINVPSHGSWAFDALPPIEFYEQLRGRTEIDVDDAVVWQGHQGEQESPAFEIRDDIGFRAADLDLRATSVRISGPARLDTASLQQLAGIRVRLNPGARVWWGGRFADTYPWNDHEATLPPPTRSEPASEFERFLEMWTTQGPRGAPMTLQENLAPSLSDQRVQWIHREFSAGAFAALVRLLIEHDLASAEPIAARGPTPMVRVHFTVDWTALLDAARGSDTGAALASVADAARGFFD